MAIISRNNRIVTRITIPRNGLIAEWLFDGNTNDTSITNNNLINYDATLTTNRKGISNGAYSFGLNKLMYSSNTISAGDTWTISVWINPTLPISDNPPWYGFYSIIEGDSLIEFLGITNDSTNLYTTVITPFNFNQTWNFILFTYSNGILSSSINDGILNSISVNNPFDSQIVRSIGYRDRLNDAHYFLGDIDDIRIYNRVLTPFEITALYNE